MKKKEIIIFLSCIALLVIIITSIIVKVTLNYKLIEYFKVQMNKQIVYSIVK